MPSFGQQDIAVPLTSVKLSNFFTVTADFTSATWNTQATHEIITVTGDAHIVIIPRVTATLTDAADGAAIQLGLANFTTALIGSTNAAGAGGATLEIDEFWLDNGPSDMVATRTALNALDFLVQNGIDVGYEITGAALTGGSIAFDVYWEGLNGGTCEAGAGGVL